MSQSLKQPPYLTVIRKVRFSSAHFLALPELSDEENLERFGSSSNRYAHGHNYEMDVHVGGPCDPATGMVVNLKDIKTILQEEVVARLDFKNLNHEVPFFKENLPTLENMAMLLWEPLKARIDALGLELIGIKINEADDLFVEYYGGKPVEL